jgi:hypothetical protein
MSKLNGGWDRGFVSHIYPQLCDRFLSKRRRVGLQEMAKNW